MTKRGVLAIAVTLGLSVLACALLLARFAVMGAAVTDGAEVWEGEGAGVPLWSALVSAVAAVASIVITFIRRRARIETVIALICAGLLALVGGYSLWVIGAGLE